MQQEVVLALLAKEARMGTSYGLVSNARWARWQLASTPDRCM